MKFYAIPVFFELNFFFFTSVVHIRFAWKEIRVGKVRIRSFMEYIDCKKSLLWAPLSILSQFQAKMTPVFEMGFAMPRTLLQSLRNDLNELDINIFRSHGVHLKKLPTETDFNDDYIAVVVSGEDYK